MSEPIAGSSGSSGIIIKSRKPKSKWEELDEEDEIDQPVRPIKKKAKKIKTFSTPVSPYDSISISKGSDGHSSGSMVPRNVNGNGDGRGSMMATDISTTNHPMLQGCRSVYNYERLNHIEEGSYGVVSRARDRETGDIVALKKLKMDQEKNGFPITSLREIRTLMMVGHHENIVRVREIVVGDTLTQSVHPSHPFAYICRPSFCFPLLIRPNHNF